MGLWSLYFLAKLYLYFRGFLQLDVLLNLLFVLFLVLPTPKRFKSYRSVAVLRVGISSVLGLLLLWHDSWLPSFSYVMTFLREEGLPSKEYVFKFVLGFFNLREIAVLASLLFLCYLVRRHIRLTAVVVVLLLLASLRGLGQNKGDVEKFVDAFYQSESKRLIRFDQTAKSGGDFDIIILHVCSLSWDDLRVIGLEGDPFFKQFDLLFTRFNSVTSYSNPSALRLLRGNCGQRPHAALYDNVPKECELFETLRAMGYQTAFTLNHDGKYSRFAEQVGNLALLDPPLIPAGLPLQAIDFDGSPIYSDDAVLEKWWELRQASGAARAAVYYNTVSLHDGAHWADEKGWWKRNRVDQYRERVQRLFKDLTHLMDQVASSGRDAVILFVPEHGMALRGSALQAPGLRDVPLPPITLVPVGIKLIRSGNHQVPAGQAMISKPTGYLALSYLLASFFGKNPFKSEALALNPIMDSIPETDFIAENEATRVAKIGPDYFFYGKEGKWLTLPADAIK